MARYRILYWKEFPSQLQAKDEAGKTNALLPQRFQQAIDAAAMAEASTDEDAYLDGWHWGEEQERPGPAKELMETLLAELEAEYPQSRLVQMIRALHRNEL